MKRVLWFLLFALLGAIVVVASQWLVKTLIMNTDDVAAMQLPGFWKSDLRKELVFFQFVGFCLCFFCVISLLISKIPGIGLTSLIIFSGIIFSLVAFGLQGSVPENYCHILSLDIWAVVYIIGSSFIARWWSQPLSASIEQLKKDAGITSS